MASKKLFLLFSILLSMIGNKAMAYYDIAVENADGVTIYYSYINNKTELAVRDGQYSGNVNIPESVTYENRTLSVTKIGTDAFKGCYRLKLVTIPNSVTSIGKNAFNGCTNLASVTIGNSVTSIGETAFKDCSGLTLVNISDLEAWCKISFTESTSNPLCYAHHLYMNGNEITNFVIPNSVTSIHDYTFYGYSGLTSVTIPNSVTNIGYRAFQYCSRLASVTMGNGVTKIDGLAFRGCFGITSVNISDLESWCKISFKGDESNPLSEAHHLYLNGNEITNLVIPNNVTSIENYSFYRCSGLTSVTIPNSVTSIGENAFSGCI